MHIGHLIRQKVEEKKIPVVRLADELSYSRTNLYKIFSKRSIDTEVLMRLSRILEFDFFSLYSEKLCGREDSAGSGGTVPDK